MNLTPRWVPTLVDAGHHAPPAVSLLESPHLKQVRGLDLGSRYGATGAAGGLLIAAGAFALTWAVILLRLRRDPSLVAPEPAVSRP